MNKIAKEVIDQTNIMDLGEHKIYNVTTFILNFETYFGLSLKEANDLIVNSTLISSKNLITYIENNLDKMYENQYHNSNISKEEIIASRLADYEYYKEVLTILKDKGIIIMNILRYLCSLSTCNDTIIEYENIFDECNMYHFKNATSGRELNRLLRALSNIVTQIQNLLLKANDLEKYHKIRIDDLARIFGSNTIYPSKKIILDKDDYYDKTSLTKITVDSCPSSFSYTKVKRIKTLPLK